MTKYKYKGEEYDVDESRLVHGKEYGVTKAEAAKAYLKGMHESRTEKSIVEHFEEKVHNAHRLLFGAKPKK